MVSMVVLVGFVIWKVIVLSCGSCWGKFGC